MSCRWVLLMSWVLVACGPEPDPSQGASVFSLQASTVSGKACPAVSSTSTIPTATGRDGLSDINYNRKIVDGEDGATFQCRVVGASSFTFSGAMRHMGRGFDVKNGLLEADGKGTADITLVDSMTLSSPLLSSSPCVVDAASAPGNNFSVSAGSMWAKFDCAAVEAAPSASCAATGVFVLDNCKEN